MEGKAHYKVFVKADGAINGEIPKCAFYGQIIEVPLRKRITDKHTLFFP